MNQQISTILKVIKLFRQLKPTVKLKVGTFTFYIYLFY